MAFAKGISVELPVGEVSPLWGIMCCSKESCENVLENVLVMVQFFELYVT